MIIDAHVHFWKYDQKRENWISDDMKILLRNYLPEHLLVIEKRNDIDALVAVQSQQAELETRFLVELAKTHPIIKGVVGWVDLKNVKVKEKMKHFSQYPVIKGWCHSGRDESTDFLLNKDFQRGIKALQAFNYTYDLLINHQQWAAAAELISGFPRQKFVIDHCARPEIRHKKIDEWKVWIREFAKYPNAYCKVSGLFTEAAWKKWSAGDFYPYLDVVFEAFGIDRLLFGSDWPMILFSGIYVQWKSLIEKYMESFSTEEREKVFGLNAIQFYGL